MNAAKYANVDEGRLKYTAEHTQAQAVEVPGWENLNDARSRLFNLGLIGVTPCGIGFGNLSIRTQADKFLISGTATGAFAVLTNNDYCLVSSFDINKNHVISLGPVRPSSESMTHGAVYLANPKVNIVIHIHSRAIFDGMVRTPYAATPKNAAYGTPEIAIAIGKCVQETGEEEGAIVLLGHDEGVITYGPTVEKAFSLIQELYNKYAK